MTTKTFFGIALTTPLWLPILLSPLARLDALAGLIYLLLASLFYGGIPYLIFLSGVFFYFRKRSGESLRDASKLFPVMFAGLLLLGLGLLGLADAQRNPWDWGLYMGVYFLAFSLVFGYAYVGLTELIYQLLSRNGFISDSSANDVQTIRLNLQ